jgi:hypothetical protein
MLRALAQCTPRTISHARLADVLLCQETPQAVFQPGQDAVASATQEYPALGVESFCSPRLDDNPFHLRYPLRDCSEACCSYVHELICRVVIYCNLFDAHPLRRPLSCGSRRSRSRPSLYHVEDTSENFDRLGQKRGNSAAPSKCMRHAMPRLSAGLIARLCFATSLIPRTARIARPAARGEKATGFSGRAKRQHLGLSRSRPMPLSTPRDFGTRFWHRSI